MKRGSVWGRAAWLPGETDCETSVRNGLARTPFARGAVRRATARVAPTRDKKCRRRRGHPYEGHEKRTDRVVRPNGVLRILDRK